MDRSSGLGARLSHFRPRVGTVLKTEDAKKAVECRAKFLMSPATVTGILDMARTGEFLYIPGVMTPTEIVTAQIAGAHIVKVYPVSALGGVQYIWSLSKAFSHIPMVASRGITIDSITDYLACGAAAVVLSDAIFNKDAISHKDFKMISELAHTESSMANEASPEVAEEASALLTCYGMNEYTGQKSRRVKSSHKLI